MSNLYETDVLAWTERRAELLRRRAFGPFVNDADIDWSNVAEEIENVARSQLSGVRSNAI